MMIDPDPDRGSGRTTAQLVCAHDDFLLDGINVLFIVLDYRERDYTRNLMASIYNPDPSTLIKKDKIEYYNQYIKFHPLNSDIHKVRSIHNVHVIYDHYIFDPKMTSIPVLRAREQLSELTKNINQRTKEKRYGQHNQQTHDRLAYGSLVTSGWVQQWSKGCPRRGADLRDYITKANSTVDSGS